MAYTHINFKTKKALKEAIAKGDVVTIFNPGIGEAPSNGVAYVEGPHYPAPHTWHATVIMKDGQIAGVR